MNTTEQRLKKIIDDELGCGFHAIKPETTFKGDLGADSLDVITLVMAMEEEFEFEIKDEEAEKIETFADALALVSKVAA